MLDSGASSHFTPFLQDLTNVEQCDVEIYLADSSTVKATHKGQILMKATSDQQQSIQLYIDRVYYNPGLNTRFQLMLSPHNILNTE